ncbi:hypothetical protein [Streptomyces sp. NPDC002580]|uniref:hypothetical protein n=1 Tax=Streptomyces sp. NPDC002580 TaxID=3364653 RepID=UPI0036C191D7
MADTSRDKRARPDGACTLSSRLKSMPSVPADAQVGRSRTVYGAAVDGNNIHGADSRWAANADSSAAGRHRYGRSVAPVPDSRRGCVLSSWRASMQRGPDTGLPRIQWRTV